MSQNIYVANQMPEDIHVFAGKSPGWVIADVLTDVALFATGIGEIKSALTAERLPEAIRTTSDLIKILKWVAKLYGGTVSVGSRPAEAAKDIIEAFKKNSIPISPGSYKNVLESGLLSYLSPSGVASLLDAETITMIIMAENGERVIDFSTGTDESWIATSNYVVRSKYGTIFDEDPGAGKNNWYSN